MKTREQKLANAIDRHISVTANAGSGKTTVLVDRYLRLITEKQNGNQPIDPKDITAITFTRLAATEMTERIINKISNRIDESDDANEIFDLSNIRSKLSNANISTIHSFCGRILREYPLEAGVPPNFIELAGAEQILIQQQTINEVIDDCLFQINAENSTEYLEVKSLIFALGGVKNLEAILLIILSKRIEFNKAKQLYNIDGYFEKIFVKDFNEKIANFMRVFIKKFSDIIANLSGISPDKKKVYLKTELDFIIDHANNILERTNLPGIVDDFSSIKESFSKFKKYLYSDLKIFTVSGSFSAKFKSTIVDSITEAEILFGSLKEFFELIERTEYNEEQVKFSRILVNLGEKLIEKYSQNKRNAEVLDFDDLMIITNELLQNNPDIVDAIRKKIKYLMVDEFQDTDSLQFSIIKKLIYDFDEEVSNHYNNLFIVGDPKQSIYGFRGADVNVFSEAKELINKTNIKRLSRDELNTENELIDLFKESDPSEKNGNITLPATFRTKPDISIFVNKICNFAFDLDHIEDSFSKDLNKLINQPTNKVQYNDLISAKNANEFYDYFRNNDLDNPEFKNLKGNVKLIFPWVNTKLFEESNELNIENINIFNDNDLIADYIIEQVSSGEYSFKDFAILSRKKSYLSGLSVKLIERGIPFINHSGGGFFELPEILDIIALLKFISDNNDDVSFLSVLKSSFCGFDSTDLYILSQASDKSATNYFQRMKGLVTKHIDKKLEQSDEFYARINKYSMTLDILKELIDFKLELTPALLLTKAFEKFNWYNKIKYSPQYQRIKANSEKLLEIARKSMEKGFKNLYDFVSEIEFIRDNYSQEPEAAIISDLDQVNLMTIHASKGLEFKNVIIIGTNRKVKMQYGLVMFDDRYGVNFNFNSPDNTSNKENNRDNVESALLRFSKILYRQRSNQEEKRIMYVGMTRAEENLILTANIEFNSKNEMREPKSDTILGYIFSSCDVKLEEYAELEEENNYRELSADTKLLCSSNEAFEVQEINKYPLNIGIYVKNIINGYTKKYYKAQKQDYIGNSLNYPEVLNSFIRGESISATRMMNYTKDKNQYTKRYILGFPDNFNVYDEDNSDTNFDYFADEIVSPIDFGNSVHFVFEHINKWFKQNKINDDELHSVIVNSLRNIATTDKNSVQEEIQSIIKSVINSKIFDNYKIDSAKQELNVNYVIGENYINSIIDLVIQHKDGDYEIWDWKTNKIHDNLNELIDKYQHQMHFYAYFLYKLYPNQKSYKSKLIFVRQSINSRNIKEWIVELEWSKQELQSYEDNLSNEINEITNYPFLNKERD